MNGKIWTLTRRDKCYVIGRRAQRLNARQAAIAWQSLSRQLEEMGDKDVPKFHDLLIAIRVATLGARLKSKKK